MASTWISLDRDDEIDVRECFEAENPRYHYVAIDLDRPGGVSFSITPENLDLWEQVARVVSEGCRRLRENLAAATGTEPAGASLSEGSDNQAAASRQEA